MLPDTTNMNRITEFLLNNLYLIILGITCIIQIVPIKINPWTILAKWISKLLTGDLQDRIAELEQTLIAVDKELAEERVQRIRWNILNFTNSCRQNHLHTKEEWDHALEELTWYESYCQDNDIPNGVIEQSSHWLKHRYKEHLENDDFLKD